MFDWNAQKVWALRELWADGKSMRQIANVLRISRNMVAGKITRLGIKRTSRPKNGQATEKRERRPKKFLQQADFREETLLCPNPPISETPVEIRSGVTNALLFRRPGECQWPIGDPKKSDFHFCCAAVGPGQRYYCSFHAKLALRPIR